MSKSVCYIGFTGNISCVRVKALSEIRTLKLFVFILLKTTFFINIQHFQVCLHVLLFYSNQFQLCKVRWLSIQGKEVYRCLILNIITDLLLSSSRKISNDD